MPRSIRWAVPERRSRPGPAGSRTRARTRARGGPGRTAGGVSPSRGCAPRRRQTRPASGRPSGACRPGIRRGRGPRASCPRGGRLAGRRLAEARRERPEPPVPVASPDRAPAARDGSQVGGGIRARPGCPAPRRGTAARGSWPSCGARSGRLPGCCALPVATVASLGWPTASAASPARSAGRSLALDPAEWPGSAGR